MDKISSFQKTHPLGGHLVNEPARNCQSSVFDNQAASLKRIKTNFKETILTVEVSKFQIINLATFWWYLFWSGTFEKILDFVPTVVELLP